jgi:hypothetical protein
MIYLFALLMSFSAWTKFDLSMGTQGRTLPSFGAELYAESGFNQLLWGKKNEPKDVLYGLIRPSLLVSSSAVINSVKGELEIFPISFLGFAVGRQIIHSNYNFPFFNCSTIACQGEFVRNFVETKMVLGFKGWVALGNYRIDDLRGPHQNLPVADWRNVIIGNPGGDIQHERKLLVAKLFSNKLIGILAENVQFMGSRERKESYAAVYQERRNDTSYMIGAGLFHTAQQAPGLIFYFRIHYQPLPSLKLF